MIVVWLLTCCNASKLRINDDYDEYPHVDLPFQTQHAIMPFPLQLQFRGELGKPHPKGVAFLTKRGSQRSRSLVATPRAPPVWSGDETIQTRSPLDWIMD